MKLQQKNAENFTFPAAPRCDPGCHPHLQDPKSILCLPHIPQCFLNERAWLCCPEEEEEENTNTSACCHRNPGQLMRHQLQNKSFSVFAALGFLVIFFPFLQSGGISAWCLSAFPKAWEQNRTFKESGAVWAEIREWAGGGTEETRAHPRRGLETELCNSWGLRKTLTLLCGENSARRAQVPFLSAGIEAENGHLKQGSARGEPLSIQLLP